MKQFLVIIILLLTLITEPLGAAPKATNHWQPLKAPNNIAKLPKLNVKAHQYQLWHGDYNNIQQQLNDKSLTEFVVTLPLPNGQLEKFKLSDSPIYHQDLSNKYPGIRTFKGQSINNPAHQGRFDITPHGFHGMFSYQHHTVFIDPLQRDNPYRYISYYRRHAINDNPHKHDIIRPKLNLPSATQTEPTATKLAGETLKSYRLAVSASGEYTQFHGGNQALALSAIVTTINRVNQIYNRDLSVQLNLVANNDTIIYNDASTDPFSNTPDDVDVIQGVIDSAIGSANYDVGHIFNTGAGGIAALGVICDPVQKAEGATGTENPTGDPFDIDYVAHELGHQFGAEHTFNGTVEACSNRSENSAYEPGSGSTIMAYAGICEEQNLQTNSDAYFHYQSIRQIQAHINDTGGSCANLSDLNNNAPSVNAGDDYTIPASTPFILTASGSDSDGDSLTYTWEQFDLGTPSNSASEMVDDGTRPLFRSFEPKSSPIRYLPRKSDILAGTSTFGETMATTSRNLNFVVTARDSAGNTTTDAMQISVNNQAGPFSVNSPTAGDIWLGETSQTVTWNVANTNISPVDCAQVNLFLSDDGGDTFNYSLLSNVENNDSATITAPNITTTSARLMIRCSNNIFFAINQGNFTLNYNSNSDNDAPTITAAEDIISYEDNHIPINIGQLTIEDSDNSIEDMTLLVLAGNNYTVSNHTVIPTSNYSGPLAINVKVNDGIADSNTFAIDVDIRPINDAPIITGASNIQTNEDSTLVLSRAQFEITDVDNNINELTLTLLEGENYQIDGNLLIPESNYTGNLTATITVSDGMDTSAPFSFEIAVIAVNDAPVLGQIASITITEDTSATLSISDLIVQDPDNQLSELTPIIVAGDDYQVSYQQDSAMITPNVNFNGQLVIGVTVSDGQLESNQQTLMLSITPVNDNPVANNDSFIVNQGSDSNQFDVLSNDSDIEADALAIISFDYDGSGTININENSISYTPNASFTGQESFSYTISDGNGGEAQATVTVIVNPQVSIPDNNNDSGGGGGSLGIWMIVMINLLRRRSKKI